MLIYIHILFHYIVILYTHVHGHIFTNLYQCSRYGIHVGSVNSKTWYTIKSSPKIEGGQSIMVHMYDHYWYTTSTKCTNE